MCQSRLAVGEAPACVQACPNEAIRIEVVGKSSGASQSDTRLVPGAFDSSYTRPTTSYRSERVTTCETRCKTVMQTQTTTEMCSVPMTTYVNEPVTATRQVCKPITTTTMQDVTTYTSANVTRTGTRKVCKPVTTTAMVDVTTYTTEAITETVQVPVAAPACGDCGATAGCGTSGSTPSYSTGCRLHLFNHFKGLFCHRGSSCGCN